MRLLLRVLRLLRLLLLLPGLLGIFLGLWLPAAQAVTYANSSYTFNWIDPSSHTKVGPNTSTYYFARANGISCNSTEPITDDTLSNAIPIGFTFNYGGLPFTKLYIMTNGRLQFGNTYCGYGSPVQAFPYPDTNMNYTMRIYGNDLDPTTKADKSTYNTPCLSISTCYISFATIGTAPNRSFVVTWNNVPEWGANSTPLGSYSLQVILQENGEFIYQYGSVTAGPNVSTGQVGWQVSTTDYEAPKTGFPASNSAIKFYIPQPVAEYRMEQTSWSSAAGQVIDTSGNGRHASVIGSAQTTASGKVCRAANIPSNANANSIDAIDTGIAMPTTVGGAGTITFWYKANSAWTGASVKDAQLLDATTVNNQWFYLIRRSNGDLRFVVTDNGGNVRAVETSAQSVAASTWKHIAVSWNFNALVASNSDHLRIYLDGALLTESAFTTSSTISSTIGTLYIGDNRSSNIDSTGTGRSADGAIDEFRVYNYEGGTALVQRDFQLGGSGCLSHYAISHSGTGSTCAQTTVTVTAHDASHGNITMPNNTTTISLTALLGSGSNRGDWTLISGYGVLNNGTADDGKATYLFNGEYQAVFGYSLTLSDTVNFAVTDGQFSESEDPLLTVSSCSSGSFNGCELAATRCVPVAGPPTYARLYTKLANTAFKLDAVKLKTDGTLETTFNGTVTVDLLANKATGVAQDSKNCPTSQTAVIPLGNATFASGRGPGAGLAVGSTAFSSVSPNYSAWRDVRMRFTCSAGVCGTAQTVCSTDNFAVRPTDFTISSNMTNTAQSGTPALNAGAAFTLTSTAVAGFDGNPVLSNLQLDQKVVTHVSDTDYTGQLSVPGNTSTLPLGTAAIATGVVSNNTVRYDDVGSFKILKNGLFDSTFTSVDQSNADCVVGSGSIVADASGKFGCNVTNQSASAQFGRFYPDNYAIWSSTWGKCNGMVYLGQDGLGITAGAIAYSKNNVPLTHFTYGYATLSGISVSLDNNGVDVPDISRLTPVLPPLMVPASPDPTKYVWLNGRAGRYHTTDAATYPAGSTSINVVGQGTFKKDDWISFAGDNNIYQVAADLTDSGPLTIGSTGLLQAISLPSIAVHGIHRFSRLPTTPEGPFDTLGVKISINDPDGAKITQRNGQAVTAASAVVSSATSQLRYGRLRITNAYGSESLPLPIDIRAQYWNGTSYFTNLSDACTDLTRSNFTIDGYTGGVTASNMSVANIPAFTNLLKLGVGKLKLDKAVNPTNITAKGSFNLNSAIGYLPGLGRETLGVYKNGPVLYIREIY
jgi:hypothetical protein